MRHSERRGDTFAELFIIEEPVSENGLSRTRPPVSRFLNGASTYIDRWDGRDPGDLIRDKPFSETDSSIIKNSANESLIGLEVRAVGEKWRAQRPFSPTAFLVSEAFFMV